LLTEHSLKKNGINVLFRSLANIRLKTVATIAYLPDFQHIHFPEMFSKIERDTIQNEFEQTAAFATRVILPTKSAKDTFEKMFSKYAHKVRVWHPISSVPEAFYDHDPIKTLELYGLPEKFVYLPNQFWKHKNHEALFKAVKALKDKGIKVIIVCTGNSFDYRHPGYFSELMGKIASLGIRDQVIYLGLIPHEHVLSLMRQSVCAVNPSLFEGWGVTVDEARSVGKQMLLSDITAHRELASSDAVFFNPTDCNDLIDKLESVWQTGKPGPDHDLEKKAREELPERIKIFAQTFISSTEDALREVREG